MPNSSEITILTADDHSLIRAGIAAVIDLEPNMRVVAEASNGEEAIEQFRAHRPALVLMDLAMPVMDGLDASIAILEEFPDAKIVMLTTFDGDENIHRALEAGVRGYLLKNMLRTSILDVIRTVHAGRRGIPGPVASRLAAHTPRIALTPRETEILRLIARGMSNPGIALEIGRTEGTVKVHVKNILFKLSVSDRTEAVTSAIKRGFIRLE